MNVHGGTVAVAPWRNAVLLAFALGGVTLATWGPRLPAIRQDLAMGDAAIGLVLSGVTVGSIAGLAASSWLHTHLGGRGAIRVSLLFVALGLIGVGLSSALLASALATAAGFVVVGFGVGALDVCVNVEGSDVEIAARRTLMPLMHAAWSAGAVVGAGIGALCTAIALPYAWQFCAQGGLIAALALFALSGIPHHRSAADQTAGQTAQQFARVPLRARLGSWARAWSNLRLLLIGVVMFGVELGEGTANNWLTLAAHEGHSQREAVASVFFVVFAVGETLARVLGNPLVDRLGRVATVRITAALGVVGVVLFILGGSVPILLVGVLLWAIGVSMGFPLGMSAAAEGSEQARAASVSVVASIGYVANLAGPPVVGVLAQSFDLLSAFWLLVLLLAAAFVFAGALRPRPTAGAPPAAQTVDTCVR